MIRLPWKTSLERAQRRERARQLRLSVDRWYRTREVVVEPDGTETYAPPCPAYREPRPIAGPECARCGWESFVHDAFWISAPDVRS